MTIDPITQHHIDTMTEQTALAQLANGMDPEEVERKRIETRAAMQKAVAEAGPIDLPPGWADAPPVKIVPATGETSMPYNHHLPFSVSSDERKALDDLYSRPDTQLTPELLDALGFNDPQTTKMLIESAEITKRALVEAENAFEAEVRPMRDSLKQTEDALRAKALAGGESIKGAHIQVQIVAPSATVKWDDKGLSGAVAMLPAEWRQAILAHRKTDEKPASTRIVYK